MDKSIVNAENIFARAIELPSAAREGFMAVQCGNDAALRHEVESLLRAHEQAGNFLGAIPEPQERDAKVARAISPGGTSIMNAAAYAEAFLRQAEAQGESLADTYVGS